MITRLITLLTAILSLFASKAFAQTATITLTNCGAGVSTWVYGGSENADFAIEISKWKTQGGIALEPGATATYRFFLPPPQYSAGIRELTQITVKIYGAGGLITGMPSLTIGASSASLARSEGWNTYTFTGSTARNLVESGESGQPYRLNILLNCSGLLDWYDIKELQVQYTYTGIPTNWLNAYHFALGAEGATGAFLSDLDNWWGTQSVAGFAYEEYQKVVFETLASAVQSVYGDAFLGVWYDLIMLPSDMNATWSTFGEPVKNATDYFQFWWSTPLIRDIDQPVADAKSALADLRSQWQSAMSDGSIQPEAGALDAAIVDALAKVQALRFALNGAASDLYWFRIWQYSSNPALAGRAKVVMQALSPLMHYDLNTGNPLDESYLVAVEAGLAQSKPFANITVQCSPPDQDLSFVVDGVTRSSAQQYLWTIGSSHNIAVTTSQAGDDGRAYTFSRWSDGNTSSSRSILAGGDASFTAIFTASGAVVASFGANADSYVLSDYPTQTHGSDNFIWASEIPGNIGRALVKFSLSSIPPTGSIVSYAELRLRSYSTASHPIELREVFGSWSEASVKWTNKPTMGSAFIASADVGADNWYVFRSSSYSGIKSEVQSWVNNASQNYGFYIKSTLTTDGAMMSSSESLTSAYRPSLIVHYTPPPDDAGDPIANLAAKRSSSGSTITANTWQKDNDPYFSWSTSGTVMPVVGYSFALDTTPDSTVDVTVPYYQYSSDSISDGTHTFYVKSFDANENWGPVLSFVIKVDATPPASGAISINNGSQTTDSLIVTLNSLSSTDAASGVDQMQFSNDGATWSSYEAYASTKTAWDLSAYGGNASAGTKTVYVRYKDRALNQSELSMDSIVLSASSDIQLIGDLSFGNVNLGSSSNRSLTISNAGSVTLTVTNLNYPSAVFTGSWSGTISPGGFANVIVTFSPTAATSYNGNLTVVSDAISGTSTKAVSGIGVLATLPTPVVHSLQRGADGQFSFLVASVPGLFYFVEASGNLVDWKLVMSTNATTTVFSYLETDTASHPQRFYRVRVSGTQLEMVLIPAGIFTMGDNLNEGNMDERPVHTVQLSAFYMDRYEVTKALWASVYDWATNHGYTFSNVGLGKGSQHPVHTINWYDAVKWCNARSQMENLTPAYYTSANQTAIYTNGLLDLTNECVKWTGNGYRLPTEAEWEKAARGVLSTNRFPWGDTISHAQANYYAQSGYTYDLSSGAGYHPTYSTGDFPYTSPVGTFASSANGYGLFDMAGNVFEWCWDLYGSYTSEAQTDPKGPSTGAIRIFRGGSEDDPAINARVAYRDNHHGPSYSEYGLGFRCVRSAVQ